MIRRYCFAFFFLISTFVSAQQRISVFGYFAGRATMIDSFPVEKLTHLCFSFTHLKGNQISLSNRNDSASLRSCVAQKKRNPALKVIVSMGGWTGCYSCSPVFASDAGRKEFAGSVKKLLNDFNADGIDLDWEYPVVKGPPGHPYSPEDKDHFTSLIRDLRDSLGKEKEISFAAGGFTDYIEKSVDWDAVTPLVDRINLMTYDLITGYDTITGHHTALYKTDDQRESCENAVDLLLKKGVPANKLLIGAAFYARIWNKVSTENDGLREKGVFYRGVSFRSYDPFFSADSGFVYHWDKKTAAPWFYNAQRQWFVTYDDERSVLEKMKFVRRKKLDGIMFWQLADDAFTNGLLDVIDRDRKRHS